MIFLQNVTEEAETRKRLAEDSLDNLINEEESVEGAKEEAKEEEEEEKEEGADVSRYYSLETVSTKHVKKYKATATDYRLRLRNLDELALDALPLLDTFCDTNAERKRGTYDVTLRYFV